MPMRLVSILGNCFMNIIQLKVVTRQNIMASKLNGKRLWIEWPLKQMKRRQFNEQIKLDNQRNL